MIVKNEIIFVKRVINLIPYDKQWVIESFNPEADIVNIQIITDELMISEIGLICSTEDGDLIYPIGAESKLIILDTIKSSTKEINPNYFEGESFIQVKCEKVSIKNKSQYIRECLNCFACNYKDISTKLTKGDISFLFYIAIRLLDQKGSFSKDEIIKLTNLLEKWPIKMVVP